MWNKICTEYELVTADGSVITANKDVNTDIFHAVPMSYGTLGFLTAVSIRIIPYKPFVRLEYTPARTLDEVTEVFTNATVGANDSVEGIMLGKEEGVIMTGNFVNENEVEYDLLNSIGLWYKPWFYLHVMTALDTGRRVEYIPTLHFHQRHNKPCFWLTSLCLPYGHLFLFRFLFGWMLPLNFQFLKKIRQAYMPKEDPNSNFIIQDFLIPIQKLKKVLEFSWETFEINPVWLCPAKMDEDPEAAILPKHDGGFYVDIGVYGCSPKMPPIPGNHREVAMKKAEQFTLDNGGQQWMYAQTYMDREQFRQMFPRNLYDSVRERLPMCKKGFPDVFDKISNKAREDTDEVKGK